MHRALISVATLMFALACNRSTPPEEASSEPPAAAAAPSEAEPTPPAAPGSPTKPGSLAGGLTWDAADPLTATPPTSRMRAAQYRVGEGPTAGELTVYHFPGTGGSVEANVERWVGQFAQPDGKPSRDAASLNALEVNGITVTTVDVTGTYTPMAMPGAPPTGPRTDQRLLGAIADGPAGPVFFKLTGPAATVESAKPAFDALVQSIRPAG